MKNKKIKKLKLNKRTISKLELLEVRGGSVVAVPPPYSAIKCTKHC